MRTKISPPERIISHPLMSNKTLSRSMTYSFMYFLHYVDSQATMPIHASKRNIVYTLYLQHFTPRFFENRFFYNKHAFPDYISLSITSVKKSPNFFIEGSTRGSCQFPQFEKNFAKLYAPHFPSLTRYMQGDFSEA